jgi:hypothetical protein
MKKNKILTAAEMRSIQLDAKNNLSSYDGSQVIELTSGVSSMMENYGGIEKIFNSQINKQTTFAFSIKNTKSSDEEIKLAYASLSGVMGPDAPSTNGAVRSAFLAANAFPSVSGLAGTFTARSTTSRSIEMFTAHYRHTPLRVVGIKIVSDNALQIEQTMTINNLSPFNANGSQEISLALHHDEHVQKDKVVTFRCDFVLSATTEVILPVVANSSCTVTFIIGESISLRNGFENKLAEQKLAEVERQGGFNRYPTKRNAKDILATVAGGGVSRPSLGVFSGGGNMI